jgi:hypothetical protein
VCLTHCEIVCAAAIKPTAPEFPEQFHTAIQISISEKGYSFVMYEAYDYSCNAVVQEYFSSAEGHMRLLFDFKGSRLWRMHGPNNTYPHGVCSSEPIVAEVPFEDVSGKHVAATQSFLGARSRDWTYEPRNAANNTEVRCVHTHAAPGRLTAMSRHTLNAGSSMRSSASSTAPVTHIRVVLGLHLCDR